MRCRGCGVQASVAIVALCGMTMLNPCLVDGQTGMPSAPEAESSRGEQTSIIPSLIVSERYDSNVFFVQGANTEDYVTRVVPQLRVIHKGQLVEGTVGGGVGAEMYVKNPGLNYVAANALIDLNLDNAMSQLVRGLGLRMSDTYYYTPQAPSFLAPAGGDQIPDAFVQGIQTQRANSHTNAATVEGSYALSPRLSFISTYKDQRRTFGQAIPAPDGVVQGSFIDTTFQTVTSGPAVQLSPWDTVTLSHQYQKATFNFPSSPNGLSTQGAINGFSTQGALAGWTRLVTPTLTANVTGGFAVFDSSNSLEYVGSASLEWAQQDTDVTLSYTRAIRPSFYIAATALLSQIVTGTVTRRVTESFFVSLNANYAINESVPDSSLIQFKSYLVTPSVHYTVSRGITATLSYTYSYYQATFQPQGFQFDRNIVLLSLAAEWQ